MAPTARRSARATAVALLIVVGAASAEAPIHPRLGGTSLAIPGVAATPPLGWDSWNTFGCNIDEDVIERAADAMVSSGMRDAGYQYVIVDDCWFDPVRTSDGEIQADPIRFPHGMRALGDYLHQRGLRFGIYASPSHQTCAQAFGAYPGATGSKGRELTDAATFLSWGVDYIKYDWCSTDSTTSDQLRAFTAMRDALRASGHGVVYSINANSGVPGLPPGERNDWSGVASMSRITNDISAAWSTTAGRDGARGVRDVIDEVAPLTDRAGPGHWNDADMLEIGVRGIPGTTTPGLTVAEQRTQFAMWSMLAAPLIAGNDLVAMPTDVRDILVNSGVLAVDQDPLGSPGSPLSASEPDIWTKPLADGSVAVALYNRADSDRPMQVPLQALSIAAAPQYRVQNLWTGESWTGDNAVKRTVAAHDTEILRVWAIAAP